jgi:hypothetical protein
MVAAICRLSAPTDITKETLILGATTITFSHKPPTPYRSDEYWLAQSPFNDRWYLFAAIAEEDFPTVPTGVFDTPPL